MCSHFQSLKQGKYLIRKDEMSTFLELYCEAVPHFTEDNCTSLVWKKPTNEYLPLTIDLDIMTEQQTKFTDQQLIDLAESLCYVLLNSHPNIKGFGLVLTRKEGQYKKKLKGGINVFKQGISVRRRVDSPSRRPEPVRIACAL